MKEITVSSLGFDLKKNVPETVSEYDTLANRVGACLDDATNSTLYRGTFAEFRNIFLHGVEAEGDTPAFDGIEQITGIKRLTKTVKSLKGEESEVWDESEAVYYKRVCAQLNLDADAARARFANVAQQAMDLASFDPSVRERASAGPKTVAKRYKAIAKDAIDSGKAQKLAELLGAKLGRAVTLTGETEKDIDILARAISDREAAKRKESEAEYTV